MVKKNSYPVTRETFKIDLLCVSETPVQNSVSITTFRDSGTICFTSVTLGLSGDPDSRPRDHADIVVDVSTRAERPLLGWISINRRLLIKYEHATEY